MKFAFRPLKEWIVTQKYGANQVCIDNLTNSKIISCDGNNPPPGYRSVYGPNGHQALDLRAPEWTRLYVCLGGRVLNTVNDSARGLGVDVLHNVGGSWYKSRYAHMNALDVSVDDQLTTGDLLGYTGNTGISTQSHLHFEIGTCDSAGNNYIPKDPEQFLYPTFALDAKTVLARVKEQLAIILNYLADKSRNR